MSSPTLPPGTRPEGTQGEEEAARSVQEMFSCIAPRYDLLNHLLSLWLDRCWRRRTARTLAARLAPAGSRALDLCCGTGDLALELARVSAGTVVGGDFAHPMLKRAREKAARQGLPLWLVEADALRLPFCDESFDVVAAAFGFRMYVQTERGKYKWDHFKLRIPVVGDIVRKATLARFARSLALATKSGVPIVQALSVVAKVVDNDYIGQRIEQMRDGVERGETILRTAVTSGVFTPVVLQMIAVGEETGSVDELMEEIAEMYDQEVEYQVKNLSAQIEPILIVGIGILVLILALGVFLPIWDLGQVALKK